MITTRVRLFAAVWATPISTLSREYGMSDRGLAKLCKRHNIPRPPRGYWAKLQAKKTVRSTHLPAPDNDYEIEIKSDPLMARNSSASREPQHGNPIIKSRLTGLHPLVIETKQVLEIIDEDRWGQHSHRRRLALKAGPECRRRGLLLMDALIRAIEQRKWRVVVKQSKYGEWHSSAIINKIKVGFALTEQRSMIAQAQSPRWMTLSLTSSWDKRQNWNDAKSQRIENLMGDFLEAMQCQAEWLQGKIDAEQREESEKEKERIRRRKIVTTYEREKARVKLLKLESACWNEAEQIRAFIAARLATNPDDPELQEWAIWAQQQADRLDPLANSPSSVLDNPPPGEWYKDNAGLWSWLRYSGHQVE